MADKMKIGIFSSSTPISATVPIRYERGKAYLEAKGFEVINGKLYQKADCYRSGTIAERADEFNSLLYDDSITVLMASIGGNNTNSILPYIDYDYFKAHPKTVIGYSDTTALLLALYAKTGIPTYYGPALASSFGEFPPFADITFDSFFDIAVSESRPSPYRYEMPPFWTDEYIDWKTQNRGKEQRKNDWLCVREGNAKTIRGRLIGGNLNTMEGFFGTEYMPKIKYGDILFIEDSLKDACTIERSFSLLKLGGVFDLVGGIILGKHELFDDNQTGKKPYEILLEVIGDRNIPILADFDCCHTHPMLTLPIGREYEFSAIEKSLVLLG